MQVNARIERLIVRKLDGEITESERLELDRELLRSADARALYESYCEVDDLAADVIKSCACGSGDQGSVPRSPVLRVRHEVVASRPWHQSWMIYASGLAACLALILILKTPESSQQQAGIDRSSDAPRVEQGWGGANGPLVPTNVRHTGTVLGHEVGVWDGSKLPAQRLDRFTDQNLIVIPSEDGGYYLFSIDHVRQVRQPKAQADSLLWNKPI